MLGGFGRPMLLPPGGSLPPPLLGGPGAASGEHQPPPREEGGSGAAGGVSEVRRGCSRANLTVCAPPCHPARDGFLLSVRGRAIRCMTACLLDRFLTALLGCLDA
jgi:hypothetical protein